MILLPVRPLFCVNFFTEQQYITCKYPQNASSLPFIILETIKKVYLTLLWLLESFGTKKHKNVGKISPEKGGSRSGPESCRQEYEMYEKVYLKGLVTL